LIYFSPTKTAKSIVEQIAAGLGAREIKQYDLTQEGKGLDIQISDGLAIIGVPVYAGRVPEICLERMGRLSATGIPVVLVALYGNRAFEDALLELRDFASSRGFSVVAAAAFIGEHSYSTRRQPIAANRPDAADLQKARKFGATIACQLQSGNGYGTLAIPGDLPYKERVSLGSFAPVTDPALCTLCGTCVGVCPTFAISRGDEIITEADACIKCCACVKNCPEQARVLNHPMAEARRAMLIQHCSEPREPVFFHAENMTYSPIKTIAIIGAGALGATYAGIFHEMDPGSVCFIASGGRNNSLKRNGVVVNGTCYPIRVVSPDEATPVDLLIVAVKHHHLDQAIAEMKQAVGPCTTILSVMNGIDSEARIGVVYGMDKVVFGLTLGIDAVREENAINYTNLGRIHFGEEINSVLTARVQRIRNLFDRAGIACLVPPDMTRSLWFKYMINVGVNQVSAVMGLTYGAIRSSTEAKELMDAAMHEVIGIARAMQVNLSEQDIDAWYKVLETLGDSRKTSMLQDVEAGRKTEVEMLAGTVIELGKRYGIPTPVNQKLFDALQQIEALQVTSIDHFSKGVHL